jgi:glycosyltransferase involved in cell wall biosynthesis
LVPSHHTRSLLVGARANPDKMVVWPRGVDTDLFTPAKRSRALRDSWHVSDNRPAILYVGRVSREKGLALLPAIRDRLHAIGVEHRLVIVGQGPMTTALKAQLPDALFTGVLSRTQVAEAFASADAFIFPSRTDTAGNVVLEAQASGMPVVLTSDGGPRENVDEGRSALVCHSDDPGEWAAALCRAVGSPAMAEAARAYALTRRWSEALEPLYRAYRDVAAARQAATPSDILPLAAGERA